jgi:Thioredoxin like C-terminal domain
VQPVSVIAGLVLSFSLLVLAGSEFLSLFHLPQDSLRNAGIALLIVVGLGYLIPPLGALIERPFARRKRPPAAGPGWNSASWPTTCTWCWAAPEPSTSSSTADTQTIDVRGVPRLYTLFRSRAATTGRLRLRVSPGIQVYDFTFG